MFQTAAPLINAQRRLTRGQNPVTHHPITTLQALEARHAPARPLKSPQNPAPRDLQILRPIDLILVQKPPREAHSISYHLLTRPIIQR